MLRTILLTTAIALSTSAAQAGGGYERVYSSGYSSAPSYSSTSTVSTVYTTPAATYAVPATSRYTAPATYGGYTYTPQTVNLGPIENVQPHLNHTEQYQVLQPAVATTVAPVIYQAPATTSIAPAAYATTYALGTSISTVPYSTLPRIASLAPSVDQNWINHLERRMDRQKTRIQRASDRGDLRKWERRILRTEMRALRADIAAFRSNDGRIDVREAAHLETKLDTQSKRIRELANNNAHRHFKPL